MLMSFLLINTPELPIILTLMIRMFLVLLLYACLIRYLYSNSQV